MRTMVLSLEASVEAGAKADVLGSGGAEGVVKKALGAG